MLRLGRPREAYCEWDQLYFEWLFHHKKSSIQGQESKVLKLNNRPAIWKKEDSLRKIPYPLVANNLFRFQKSSFAKFENNKERCGNYFWLWYSNILGIEKANFRYKSQYCQLKYFRWVILRLTGLANLSKKLAFWFVPKSIVSDISRKWIRNFDQILISSQFDVFSNWCFDHALWLAGSFPTRERHLARIKKIIKLSLGNLYSIWGFWIFRFGLFWNDFRRIDYHKHRVDLKLLLDISPK